MAKRDYYDVLGLSKGADSAEIKKAYRKLAVEFHPDKNQGDSAAEEKFKEIAESYSILSNDEKRAKYDRFGHAAENMGGGGFGGDPFGGGGFGGGVDLSDALRQFMDQGSQIVIIHDLKGIFDIFINISVFFYEFIYVISINFTS